jgi:hypothetical protein
MVKQKTIKVEHIDVKRGDIFREKNPSDIDFNGG